MAAPKKVMAVVLAGGEGKRLMPLTADRAKPAVPYGGVYRLVDFALSNLVNSRYLKIVVLTQYKSHSLDRHISTTWRMSTLLGNYVAPVPAQQRVGKHWYLGSADAIFQSLNLLDDERPDIVVVVGADHVYRMDFSQMVEAAHRLRRRRARSRRSGSRSRWPTSSGSSRPRPRTHPDRGVPGEADRPAGAPRRARPGAGLDGQLRLRRRRPDRRRQPRRRARGLQARHGRRHRARLRVAAARPSVYDFKRQRRARVRPDRDRDYWRDVGTLDAYFEAQMDLVSVHPVFNLYNYEWPIYTAHRLLPAGQVRPRLARAHRARRELDRLPRRRRLRRPRRELGALAERRGAQLGHA